METPLLSINLTTYNALDSIKITLPSIAEQTLDKSKYELLILDDGSIDETYKFIDDFKKQHPDMNIKYWYCTDCINKTRNSSFARNILLKKSIGEYIILTESDIIYKKDILERHLALQELHNGQLFAQPHCFNIYPKQAILINQDNFDYLFNLLQSVVIEKAVSFHNGAEEDLKQKSRKRLDETQERLKLFGKITWRTMYVGPAFCSSIGKDILMDMNGYDEDFKYYGGCDSDIRNRIEYLKIPMMRFWDLRGFHIHHFKDSSHSDKIAKIIQETDVKLNKGEYKRNLNRSWGEGNLLTDIEEIKKAIQNGKNN